MFRKIALVTLAAASIAAVAPSAASAHGMGGHGGGHGMHMGGHGGHWGGHFRYGRFYSSNFFAGGSCYRTVFGEFGPRRINVCNVY
jgi:hypothetical protein